MKIENPCGENYNNMLPGTHARHCNVCNKAVYDFTGMNHQEIINWFNAPGNEGACGRYRKGQVQTNRTTDNFYYRITQTILGVKMKHARLFLLALLGWLLSFSSCIMGATMKPTDPYTVPPVVNDSTTTPVK